VVEVHAITPKSFIFIDNKNLQHQETKKPQRIIRPLAEIRLADSKEN